MNYSVCNCGAVVMFAANGPLLNRDGSPHTCSPRLTHDAAVRLLREAVGLMAGSILEGHVPTDGCDCNPCDTARFLARPEVQSLIGGTDANQ